MSPQLYEKVFNLAKEEFNTQHDEFMKFHDSQSNENKKKLKEHNSTFIELKNMEPSNVTNVTNIAYINSVLEILKKFRQAYSNYIVAKKQLTPTPTSNNIARADFLKKHKVSETNWETNLGKQSDITLHKMLKELEITPGTWDKDKLLKLVRAEINKMQSNV